jgi:rhamnose transport system permease protein
LVVTLGTLALFRGLAYVVLGDQAVSDFPSAFTSFGFRTIPGTHVPWTVLVFVPLLALFAVILHRSWVGRQLYAIGTNREAARYSAVRVHRLTLAIYAASGLLAAVAGIMFTARVSSARADNAEGFELDVIAAVLLGGVSIFGGRGTLLGVALALATIATLRNVLALNSSNPELQSIAVGGLLILSVLGPNLVRRLTARARFGRRAPGELRAAGPGD